MLPLLVTGLTGLVASRFQELFKSEFNFTNIDLATGIDITNKTLVTTAVSQSNAPTCIHFAAFTNVDGANNQNGDKNGSCYQINVLGTRHIATACSQTGKYLIHISTDFVFDGANPPQGGYTEDDPPHPIEWYGQTKLWAEQEVKNSGAEYCIARLSYPFRADYPQKLDLVRTILDKLQSNSLPPMFSDHLITPTFIDDIAPVLKAMIEHQTQGIFHVVGSSHVSDYELAVKVAHTFGLDESLVKPGSLEEFLTTTRRRPYQKRLLTSNAKLTAKLGISMRNIQPALEAMKHQIQS